MCSDDEDGLEEGCIELFGDTASTPIDVLGNNEPLSQTQLVDGATPLGGNGALFGSRSATRGRGLRYGLTYRNCLSAKCQSS
jgi:hypothetical protein